MTNKSIKITHDRTIVSEVQLSYKCKQDPKTMIKIQSSKDSYEILKPFFEDVMSYREFFYVIYLNRRNRVLSVHKLSEGGCSGTVVDPKMVFQGALLANAQAIILCHNHPSGECNPSEQDKIITRNIYKAGEALEISVLDHIIISEHTYYSFADEGLLK